MSKRIIAMVIAIVLAAALFAGCGKKKMVIPEITSSDAGSVTGSGTNDAASSVAASSPDSASSQAKSIDTNKVAKGIKVEGIPYHDEYSNKLFLLLTNESGADCNVSVNVDFFDKDGKIVGTTSGYVDAFQNGTTVVENFYCDDPFEKYEYSVAASDLSYYVPIDKDLKVEINKATNKAIVSVTNNSKKAAKYPEYYAFFYKDGKLVYDNWGFVDDADGEIKPGATQREEASCYEEFDDVKVFVHSYADKDDKN